MTVGTVFRPSWAGRRTSEEATKRLRLIVTLDRAGLSPHMVQTLREEIRQVVSRYLVIDQNNLEVNLGNRGDQPALEITVPVVTVRRGCFPA